MKNWETIDADITLLMTKHFTPGRDSIDYLVLHHNAGNGTVESIWQGWQTREASAQYQVENGGRIGQLVWDRDTAWHASAANRKSIGIEHANNTFEAGGWTISEAAIENGSHLVAALCKFYKLGRPAWMVNVYPHRYFDNTACPGALNGMQNAQYMKRAGEHYDAMMAGKAPAAPAPAPAPAKKSITEIAQAVMRGEWGNGQDRFNRLAAAGYDANAVQNEVNHLAAPVTPVAVAPARKSNEAIAHEVIAGSWGNGEDRLHRLSAAGYDYNAIQNAVNAVLGAPVAAPSRKSNDDVAREVIRGEWGNGQDRFNRLAAAGYDANTIQSRVNALL